MLEVISSAYVVYNFTASRPVKLNLLLVSRDKGIIQTRMTLLAVNVL